MLFKTIILSFFTLLSIHTAWAEPATDKSVRELLIVTGAGNMGVQVMNGMIEPMKKIIPQAPDTFWTEFMSEVSPNDLVNMLVPIYQKHYSEEDILALITFYKTPLGQRMLTSLPMVMKESMQVGQQWGQEIGKRALQRAKDQNLAPAK